jgi:hypothetical protein
MAGDSSLFTFYHILKNYDMLSVKNNPLPLNIDLKDARNNNLDIMMIIKKDIEL